MRESTSLDEHDSPSFSVSVVSGTYKTIDNVYFCSYVYLGMSWNNIKIGRSYHRKLIGTSPHFDW